MFEFVVRIFKQPSISSFPVSIVQDKLFEKLAKDLVFASKKLESEKNKYLLYCFQLIL